MQTRSIPTTSSTCSLAVVAWGAASLEAPRSPLADQACARISSASNGQEPVGRKPSHKMQHLAATLAAAGARPVQSACLCAVTVLDAGSQLCMDALDYVQDAANDKQAPHPYYVNDNQFNNHPLSRANAVRRTSQHSRTASRMRTSKPCTRAASAKESTRTTSRRYKRVPGNRRRRGAAKRIMAEVYESCENLKTFGIYL